MYFLIWRFFPLTHTFQALVFFRTYYLWAYACGSSKEIHLTFQSTAHIFWGRSNLRNMDSRRNFYGLYIQRGYPWIHNILITHRKDSWKRKTPLCIYALYIDANEFIQYREIIGYWRWGERKKNNRTPRAHQAVCLKLGDDASSVLAYVSWIIVVDMSRIVFDQHFGSATMSFIWFFVHPMQLHANT